MKNSYTLIFVSAALLAGCAAVVPTPSAPSISPAPVQPQGTAGVPLKTVPNSAMSQNRAVIALLDQSQLDNGTGHRASADSALERALRIEPRNPWLWHQLAQLRMDQGQYAQAITLAGKSNSFAGNQNGVLAANWQVIGQARVALGDPAGAEDAFKRAADFAQQDKAAQVPGFSLP
ncbi:MAG: tetratricopeptide repeat protein [Gallionella sp.]